MPGRLDVVIDNTTRTLLWALLVPTWGTLLACFEWATFSCTHGLGSGWKTDFSKAPGLVTRVMAQGFKVRAALPPLPLLPPPSPGCGRSRSGVPFLPFRFHLQVFLYVLPLSF